MRSHRPTPECRSCVQRKAPLRARERLHERPRSSANPVGMRRHHRDASPTRQAWKTCYFTRVLNGLRDLRHCGLWPNLRALLSRMRLMGLRERFNDAMKDAMRAKAVKRLSTVRLILAAVKDRDIAARTEASREGVSDEEILGLLAKMIKQREESAATYESGGRPELAA